MNRSLTLPVLGFCVLLLNLAPAQSQILGLRTYTQLDGYPASAGFIIDQYATGYIWIGSDHGAIRFDGQHFDVFDAEDGLADQEIIQPHAMFDSSVLLSPMLNNLAYYKNGKIITASQNHQLLKVQNSHSNRAFRDDATQDIWITDGISHHKVFRFRNEKVEAVSIDSLKQFGVDHAYDQKLYLTGAKSEEGIRYYEYDLAENKAHPLRLEGFSHEEKLYYKIQWSIKAEFAAIHASSQPTTHILRREGKSLKRIRSFNTPKPVRNVRFDRHGNIWALYQAGGFSFWKNPELRSESEHSAVFLNDVIIHDAFVDRDDNVWLTTDSKGLFFISKRHWENTLLTTKNKWPAQVAIRVAIGEKTSLWASYQQNPRLYALSQGGSKVVFESATTTKGFRQIQPWGDFLVVADQEVFYILEPSKSPYSIYFQTNELGSIKHVFPISDTSALVSTHSALYEVELRQGSSQPSITPVLLERTTSAVRLSKGYTVVGTPNGIKCLDGQKCIDHQLQQANVTCMNKLSDTETVLGSSTHGVYMYNAEKRHSTRIAKPADLNHAYIRRVYTVKDSSIWLVTDNGVFHLSHYRNNPKLRHYTFFDGLPSNDIKDLALRNDTLFVATSEGLTVIPKSALEVHKKSVLPQVVSAKIGDSALVFPRKLEFQYPMVNAVLSLSTFSYHHSQSDGYSYRLKGIMDNWVSIHGTQINLNQLNPGDYTLEFKRSSSYPSQVGSLPIVVKPAMWQTWWFRLIEVMILLGIVTALLMFFAKRWKRRLEKKAAQQKQLAEIELEAVKAQINPHFISNCLNSIQYFHIKKQFDRASEYLNLFARLINLTLQYSQESFITLGDEIDYLNNYLRLEKMRFQESLSYNFKIDEKLSMSRKIPAMLLQPHVENAIKHGITPLKNGGQVSLEFRLAKHDGLSITIADNGPGFKPENLAMSKSLGHRLSKSRAKVYQSLFDLNITVNVAPRNNNKPGTVVSLLIPNMSDVESVH